MADGSFQVKVESGDSSADLLNRIKQQVEFYFSDSNYRKDTFLRACAETNSEHFIPIAVLLTFNKLKALTTDIETVRKSVADSDLVIISSDNLQIKRATPLPEEDTSHKRTLYVKGYPIDDSSVTIEAVAEQFSNYGKVNMIKLRKDFVTKAFKGSCFIEYSAEEAVDAAVTAAYNGNEVKLSYKGQPFVCVMRFTEWLQRKEDKRKKLKEKRKGDAVEKGGSFEEAASKRVKEEGVEVEYVKGLVVKVTKFPENVSALELRDFFKTYGDVKFVDIAPGDASALVRVGDNKTATDITSAIEKGVSMTSEGIQLEGKLIEGDEEKQFWIKREDAKNKTSNSSRGSRGGRGRGGGRGSGRGRGRGANKRQRN